MATLPTDYTDATTPTGATTELPATTSRGINAINAEINSKAPLADPAFTGTPTIGGAPVVTTTSISVLSNKQLNIFDQDLTYYDYPGASKLARLQVPSGQTGSTTRTHILPTVDSVLVGRDTTDILTGKTLTSPTLTTPVLGTPASGTLTNCTGLPASGVTGLTTGNTSAQSQVVVSATAYYIAGSAIAVPTNLAVGSRFRWTVAMAKTAAGTGTFQIRVYRGTNGTTADTADVTQSIGTQTAAVDNMMLDVEIVVTTTGATGAYYWSIIPTNKAITATGFGVATGPTGQFSGTVSSVALNTASLKFGLSFIATTGTPTITVPLVRSQAYV